MIKAEYISHMGDDLTVVNSARVSFDKESEWEADCISSLETKTLSDKDKKLISYLAKHKHTTPFTHPQITLRETVPIFVARQRFKHVVGFTYNETSRRYVDTPPEYYIPDQWRKRPTGSVKQGSGDILTNSDKIQQAYLSALFTADNTYKELLEAGVAPEQARMVLPQSMMTSYYVTGSLLAFSRMYNQRIDPHAQKEIQDLAKQVNDIIEPLYPVSWAALTKGDY